MDGARPMASGKYDVFFFAEYDLYGPALEPKHQMHDRMCVTNKGTMTCLSYKTNDGARTKWNQYRDTRFTINADLRGRMTQDGWDSDSMKLGRWMWTKIGETDEITTVFVSAYRPCHSPDGAHMVWQQQVRYLKQHEDIRNPDVHALFIRDLSKFLGNF